MLIDNVSLKVKAGNGGDGVVAWRREKFVPLGGPAGGDGGKGGDVYIRVVQDIEALNDFKNKKEWMAENGEPGKKRSMFGHGGEDLYLRVPVGSTVYNKTYEIRYECNTIGEEILILRGGKGGLGNENFKSSTNRSPEIFTKGERGEDAELEIELKLIADIGLIGLPNAGKSSLLNAVTNAQAKIGSYPFTTLEPNLGTYKSLVLADLPGIIEGAHEGKGLGFRFLKHISRTRILFHLVSVENENIKKAYLSIREELKKYDLKNKDNKILLDENNKLSEKKEIIILTKTDEIKDKKELDKIVSLLAKASKQKKENIILLSLYDDNSVKSFIQNLEKLLK